jgi:hypothetical protein
MKKLYLLFIPFLLIANLCFGRGMVVGSGAGGLTCLGTPFISQVDYDEESGSAATSGYLWQYLKASDVNGKTVCKVCVNVGTIDTSPWVFNIAFQDTDGDPQYGDTSGNLSASGAGEICIEWTSGTKPTLPNATVRMKITTVSGDGRIRDHTDETKYQDTSYDAWMNNDDQNVDLYMKVYPYE